MLEGLIAAFGMFTFSGACLVIYNVTKIRRRRKEKYVLFLAYTAFFTGALCMITTGHSLIGVVVFGGIVTWTIYVILAHVEGVFKIEVGPSPLEASQTEALQK